MTGQARDEEEECERNVVVPVIPGRRVLGIIVLSKHPCNGSCVRENHS